MEFWRYNQDDIYVKCNDQFNYTFFQMNRGPHASFPSGLTSYAEGCRWEGSIERHHSHEETLQPSDEVILILTTTILSRKKAMQESHFLVVG